nr:immunoglobulin light chain junction region [Macaca mulatta]MOV35048.1 immunoglobulin light chain junction region [Macaca mulatta]
CHQYNTYPFTF